MKCPYCGDNTPDAWKVATRGTRANAIVATPIAGVIGSCTWTTSNRSRSRSRLILKTVLGLKTMLGSAPFAGTITERPTGIT